MHGRFEALWGDGMPDMLLRAPLTARRTFPPLRFPTHSAPPLRPAPPRRAEAALSMAGL